jgi:hypothetical protein
LQFAKQGNGILCTLEVNAFKSCAEAETSLQTDARSDEIARGGTCHVRHTRFAREPDTCLQPVLGISPLHAPAGWPAEGQRPCWLRMPADTIMLLCLMGCHSGIRSVLLLLLQHGLLKGNDHAGCVCRQTSSCSSAQGLRWSPEYYLYPVIAAAGRHAEGQRPRWLRADADAHG